MNYILNCDIEPFPYNEFEKFFRQQSTAEDGTDGLCFYQTLNEPDIEKYSDKPIAMHMIDVRNQTCDKCLELNSS